MINKILILDDQISDDAVKGLLDTLNGTDEYFVKATSDYMNVNLDHMDLLIIDWDLTGMDTNGKISQGIINKVLNQRVVPIIIYTSHSIETVSGELANLKPVHKELVKVVNKGNLNAAVEEIKKALGDSENQILKISYYWKAIVKRALDKSLSNVNKRLNNQALALLMKEFKIDQQALPTALTELLSDLLSSELEPLHATLTDTESNPGILDGGYEAYKWLDKIRKYTSPSMDRGIFTGDIFITEEGRFGIVITPKCDLVRPSASSKVNYLIGEEFGNKINVSDTETKRREKVENIIRNHFIKPSEKEYWMFDVPNYADGGDEEVTLIFRYDHVKTQDYSTFHSTVKRLANVRSPYIDDLVQGYTKYQLRVGLPSRPFSKDDKPEREAYVKAVSNDYISRYASGQESVVTEVASNSDDK